MRLVTRSVAAVLTLLVLAAGCGSNDKIDQASPTTTSGPDRAFSATVASYDLGADGPQRFIVGLVGSEGRLWSFGTVKLNFVYLGTKEQPREQGSAGPDVVARWIPIPGQDVDAEQPGPRLVEASDGVGVYEARDVRFDQPGFWGVVVTAAADGGPRTAKASFEVRPQSLIPGPGDPAPRTVNLRPGAADAPAKAVDSRADADGSVPDPELHTVTVADAIGTGRPTLLVISTPVFCMSRFCGPITDAIQRLAKEFAGRMHFAHIEVWRDFEKKEVNKAAAEWIMPPGTQDANEPWVFLIGGDGVVQRRWDNVASEPDLRASVAAATA